MALIQSNPSPAVSVSTVTANWYLKDPLAGTVLPIFVEPPLNTKFSYRSTAYDALGRSNPIVLGDVQDAMNGQIVVLTTEQYLPGGCTYAQLYAYLTKTTTLLLISPYRQWYVQLMGDKATVLESGGPNAPVRRTTIPWQEVDSP